MHESRGIDFLRTCVSQNEHKHSVGRNDQQLDTGPHRMSEAEQNCRAWCGCCSESRAGLHALDPKSALSELYSISDHNI